MLKGENQPLAQHDFWYLKLINSFCQESIGAGNPA
jgi:hypothetical protein